MYVNDYRVKVKKMSFAYMAKGEVFEFVDHIGVSRFYIKTEVYDRNNKIVANAVDLTYGHATKFEQHETVYPLVAFMNIHSNKEVDGSEK